MTSKGKRVLLLRAPAEDTADKYETEFLTQGYVPYSVPTLETVFENVETLREKIERGPRAGGVDGVVMTSQRSVEAWCEAVRLISEDKDHDRDGEADWGSVPFYVVGEATAGAVGKIREGFRGLVRGGAGAGNAGLLADFILDDLSGEEKRLLYLTGDKNREILPQKLDQGGVGLYELQVYHTIGSSRFGTDLKDVLERAGGDKDEEWGWVVYFAPSAAEFSTPFLHDAFRFRGEHNSDDAVTEKPILKVAVIGSTTASSLRDTLKLHVDVVAPKPRPDALANAIVAFDSA